MRVTNNMIMKSSTNNVNATKVNVNDKNNQMTTNKKISRPSEDPVIAIRALRLGTTFNKLDQYASKNIPDAASWLDVTETAILNMKSLITDMRTQCVNGSTGTLTADDRNTILSQLQALQKQMYSEGNADYAGRTVFTGFRTNSTLTFSEDEMDTSYSIREVFSTKDDMREKRFYNGDVKVPSTQTEVLTNPISDIEETSYNTIRLPYNSIDKATSIVYRNNGSTSTFGIDGPTSDVYDADGNYVGQYQESNIDGPDLSSNTTVYQFDSEEVWAAKMGKKTVGDNDIVIIKNTGEMIFGNQIASTMKQNNINVELDYDKTGFTSGELRPEFYYNCTDKTNPLDEVHYKRYEEIETPGGDILITDELIRYDIEYNVATNQNLAVNIEAIDVFDSDVIQDVNDMINAVSAAINAHDKMDKIKSMMKENQYATDEYQEKLNEWLEAAQKEADYADDNVQKLFSSNIGRSDNYLSDISLALTKVGCKSDQLSITEDRVGNQQSTVSKLQSDNEDVDLSQIILEYTSAYTAYQASLTAASKLGQVSLLNYI